MKATVLRVLEQFVAEPRPCSYLEGRSASLEYRVMTGVSAEELERLLERGWRRFGLAYFRPACRACTECVPLRVPVSTFVQSRSQRRVLAKGAGFRMRMDAPGVDDARMNLYHRWHAGRSERRGWDDDGMTPERYFHEFAFPHPAAREITWFDGDKLIAVSLVDETPRALSAVYTYHDPDYERFSLGTLSVLTQIEIARRSGKNCVYLGYRVLGCASSQYKARYLPHEVLRAMPATTAAPEWTRVDTDPLAGRV